MFDFRCYSESKEGDFSTVEKPQGGRRYLAERERERGIAGRAELLSHVWDIFKLLGNDVMHV